jgi:hypothetical protein
VRIYELPKTIPDVKVMLAQAPEDLESTILKKRSETMFHTGNLQKELWGRFTSGELFPGFWFETRGTRTVQRKLVL